MFSEDRVVEILIIDGFENDILLQRESLLFVAASSHCFIIQNVINRN